MKQVALKEREALIKRTPPDRNNDGTGCGVVILLIMIAILGWLVLR